METVTEPIKAAVSAAQARNREDLEQKAEQLLGELRESLERESSVQQRLGDESSVKRSLGPLGQSTMRTEVFAELQRGVGAAKTGAARVSRLGALEYQMQKALGELRALRPDAAFQTIQANTSQDRILDALKGHEENQAPVVALVGKMRAAQLHLAALYRDGVHDEYFKRFSISLLDGDERHFLAPLVLFAVDVPPSDEVLSLGRLAAASLPVIVVRVHTMPSGESPALPDLPLPYAARAFSPQWTWLQTTWDTHARELPPLLRAAADLNRITGPVFIDVLACDSCPLLQLAEDCGVWPKIRYFPGDLTAGQPVEPMGRSSSAEGHADLNPAFFAWQILRTAPLRSHFVELQHSAERSRGKPLGDYLALPRDERHYYFPFFVADGKARLVPPDVLHYCEQLGYVNTIWQRLGPAPAEPLPKSQPAPTQPERNKPSPEQSKTQPENKTVQDEAMRSALERMLERLIELGGTKNNSRTTD